MKPRHKAALAVCVFGAAGAYALLFLAPPSSLLAAHALFFATLLVNTFFSIRFFAAIQPNDTQNALVDAFLVITYIVLALSLGRPVGFSVAALFLFLAASTKYVLMLGKVPHVALLRRKILIDSVGTFAVAVLLVMTLSGYAFEGAWVLAAGFLAANIYLLTVRPMYQL